MQNEIQDEKIKFLYLTIEDAQIRLEKNNKRMWILCIILIIALIGTNAGWIYYESQWQYTEENTKVEQEIETGNGTGNTTVTGIGDIYGTSQTDGQQND